MALPAFHEQHQVAIAAARARVSPSLIVQRNKGWTKVHEEGRCRMCQRGRDIRPLTRHHVVPLAYFRRHPKIAPLRHAETNIVGLCEPCHRLIERDAHARVELRRSLGAAEVAFAIQVAGRRWFDERYPERPAAHVPYVIERPILTRGARRRIARERNRPFAAVGPWDYSQESSGAAGEPRTPAAP